MSTVVPDDENRDFAVVDFEQENEGDSEIDFFDEGKEQDDPDPAKTRFDDEVKFVVQTVGKRLGMVRREELYEVQKWTMFAFGMLLAIAGATLFLFAFGIGPLFAINADKIDVVALVFASIFCIPILIWFYYVFVFAKHNEKELRRRNTIHKDRFERKLPGFFNKLMAQANEATEPPVRKIRVYAHIRKHDYPVFCSNWREFCEQVQAHVGIPIERQHIRWKDKDLDIDLLEKLDRDYGLDNNDRLHVYNRGGLRTENHNLKLQYRAILESEKLVLEGDDYIRSVFEMISDFFTQEKDMEIILKRRKAFMMKRLVQERINMGLDVGDYGDEYVPKSFQPPQSRGSSSGGNLSMGNTSFRQGRKSTQNVSWKV